MNRILCWMLALIALLPGSSVFAQAGRYIPRVPSGGGGAGGRYFPFHLPGQGTGGMDDTTFWVIVGLVALVIVVVIAWKIGAAVGESQGRTGTSSTATQSTAPPPITDRIHPPGAVAERLGCTTRLLEFLAHRDPGLDPRTLSASFRELFLTVQQCWQRRDYAPVSDRIGPRLLSAHQDQLAAMRRAGEVNRLEDLSILRLELVHIESPGAGCEEVTALITFTAKSWIADDRTGAYRRGSLGVQTFQEFWIFHRQPSGWRLATIEQTATSTRLGWSNRVEGLSEEQLRNAEWSLTPGFHPPFVVYNSGPDDTSSSAPFANHLK